MTKHVVGSLMTACFALCASIAQADSSCGCGQVATPVFRGCATSVASPCCGSVASDCGCCAVTYQTRIVYDTQMVTEMKTVVMTECQPETRTVDVTTYQRVPRTETKTRTYTVCVPTQQVKDVTYTVCVPETHQVEQTVNVCVPYTEEIEQTYTTMEVSHVERTGTRMVNENYTETLTRTVCRDQGSWECQTYEVPVNNCGSAGGSGRGGLFGGGLFSRCCARKSGGCNTGCATACNTGCDTGCGAVANCCAPATRTVTCRVWVPNIVTEEVPYTVTRCRQVPQEYTYTERVCTPVQQTRTVTVQRTRMEPQTRTVNVTRMVQKQETKQVTYCVMVPETKTEEYQCTTYECVPTTTQKTITVMVPVQVTKEVPVTRCIRVPREVQVPCSTGCNTGGGRARGGLFSRLGGRCCKKQSNCAPVADCCVSTCDTGCSAPAPCSRPRRSCNLFSRSRAASCGC